MQSMQRGQKTELPRHCLTDLARMRSLSQRFGIYCLILTVLLARGKAEPCSVTTRASCPDIDQTELLQRQVDVAEFPMIEDSGDIGSAEVEEEEMMEEVMHGSEDTGNTGSDEVGTEDILEEDSYGSEDDGDTTRECATFTTQSNCQASGCAWSGGSCEEDVLEKVDALLQDEQDPGDTGDTDIECSSFTTAKACHAGGCTWGGNSCELDGPNPDDTNVECPSFTTEHHCGIAGCIWTDNKCKEDDNSEQADALLQENVSAASDAFEDQTDIENAGTTWCRRRRVHRRRWRSWGCRRRRAKPTIKKAPTDGYFQECWTAGGCKDDGKTFCGWCGQHNGNLMYCCNKKSYASGHACHGALFSSTNSAHHCVLPGTDSGAPTMAYQWLDLSGASAKQSSTAHGGKASRAIDGSATATWSQGSCTHTYGDNNPWWQVDLKSKQVIKAVALTNRGDCCGSRLDGFSVKVGNEMCATGVKIKQGETKMVKCSDTSSASTIEVKVNKRTCLTICEFRAAVQAGPPAAPLQARIPTPNKAACDWLKIAASCTECNKYYDSRTWFGDNPNGWCQFVPSNGKCWPAGWAKTKGMKTETICKVPTTPAPTTPAPTTPAPTPAQILGFKGDKTTSEQAGTTGTKTLFDRVDLDSDGSVTREELQKALEGGKIESTVVPTPAAPTIAAARVAPTVKTSSILSQDQKNALLRKHNNLRKDMGASDMTKMRWDDTLAIAAQQWASSCAKGHSQNRGNSVGENMAWKWSSGFQLTASTDLRGSVQAWYDEIKDAGPYKSGGTFGGFGKCTGVCGHYTQVVWAAANKLGCGVASCPHSTGMPGYELVCQYGSDVPGGWGGNMGSATVFTKGSACSSCPSGFNKCSDNLCST